jgi:hypothetical protein
MSLSIFLLLLSKEDMCISQSLVEVRVEALALLERHL